MTATAVPDQAPPGDTSVGDAIPAAPGPQPLYHSPWGLLDFQALACAMGYSYDANLFVYDTGIGKSHIAMGSACLLFEDQEIDLVLLVAEKNKLERDEWPKDIATFTDLTFAVYHGDIKRRAKIRADLPQVLLSTYETIRNDCALKTKVENRQGKKVDRIVPGPLAEVLRGKRVLVVYDEMTKLGNRGKFNSLHHSHELLLKELRAATGVRVMGLTATPIERSPENFYNLGRLMIPDRMPTVAVFERDYVKSKDIYGNYATFKNLSEADHEDPDVPLLRDLLKPILRRKRKTDPDVIEQFPKVVEQPPTFIHLDPKHQEFYKAVEELSDDFDEWSQRQFFTLLRQIAGHPLSLLRSKGKLAERIAAEVGEIGLASLGSAKCDRLVSDLVPIVKGQGAQVVIFTFFANSVLPLIEQALVEAKFTVAVNAPYLSDHDRTANKAAFRAGGREIFLTSDAGARGINLPEATYCLEYESALTHANRTQRWNRIHRIDSKAPSVTVGTLVALDTVEEGIVNNVLTRNGWSDQLLEDEDTGEDFISAAERKRLMRLARRRAQR